MKTIPTCEGNKIIIDTDGMTHLSITPPEGIKEQEKETKNNVNVILK